MRMRTINYVLIFCPCFILIFLSMFHFDFFLSMFQMQYRHPQLKPIGFFNASILTQLLPCTILIIATIAILIKLRAAKERKAALRKSACAESNDQTSNALLAILILFLICELPLGIILMLNIVDIRFYSVLLSLFHFTAMLRLLNASLNFILYCTMSSLFRSTFKEVVSSVLSELTSSDHIDSHHIDAHYSTSKKEESIEMSR